jgi:site-specific DNA-cytosine methylase
VLVDYGLPQMRKRLFIGVRNDTDLVKHVNKLLDLDEYRRETTLSELLGKKILRKTRLTLFGVAAEVVIKR